MKRILITILTIIISTVTFSQTFPITSTLGNKSTKTQTAGTYGSLTGFTWVTDYGDTTNANVPDFVKATPGMVIRTTNTFWVRNNAATTWVQISGGGGSGFTTASNGNVASGGTDVRWGGRFTGDITVSAANNKYLFDSLDARFVSHPRTLATRIVRLVSTNGTDSSYIEANGGLTGTSRLVQMGTNSTATGTSSQLQLRDAGGNSISQLVVANAVNQSILNVDTSIISMARRRISGGAVYNSVLELHNSYADQWADDSLIWRTTDRESFYKISHGVGHLYAEDSLIFEAESGVYTFTDLLTGTTSNPVAVFDANGHLKKIAQSSIVGAVPTFDATLAAGSSTTTNRTVTVSAGDQFLFNTSAGGAFIINSETSEKFSASSSNTIITGGTSGRFSAIGMRSDSIFIEPALGKINIDSLRDATTQTKVMGWGGVGNGMVGAFATTGSGTTVPLSTSPSFTTSVLTGSTTLAVFNTTATTVNAFGAATTVNTGASATQIWNFGGSTTASQFRYLEPSASGTNYIGFKAPIMAGNTVYDWPNAFPAVTGYVLSSTTAGVMSWVAQGGGGWALTGTSSGLGTTVIDYAGVNLTIAGGTANRTNWNGNVFSTGDLGGSFNTMKFAVDGSADIAYVDNITHTALVGINTSTPTVALEIAGQILVNAGSATNTIKSTGVTALGDYSGSTYIEIGGSGASDLITYNASQHYFQTGVVTMAAYTAGAATFDASGNISSVSDGRLKFIQGTYNAGLNELMQLHPIIYKWRPESRMETEHQYAGLDAREVYKVLGELGTGKNKEGYYSIQDRSLIVMLINAVQEQQKEIEYLKSKVK